MATVLIPSFVLWGASWAVLGRLLADLGRLGTPGRRQEAAKRGQKKPTSAKTGSKGALEAPRETKRDPSSAKEGPKQRPREIKGDPKRAKR